MRYSKWTPLLLFLFSFSVTSGTWEVEVGAFFSKTDTKVNARDPYFDTIRTIDFESDLELKDNAVLPYLEIEYYFNDKHNVFFDWRSLHREATRSRLTKPFELELEGETYVFQAGSKLTTALDVDIARLGYGYQFYKNDDLTIDALAGFHVMWLSLGFAGEIGVRVDDNQIPPATAGESVVSDVTAPLPDFGLRLEYKFNEDWVLKAHTQAFYLGIDDFEGWLYELDFGAKYLVTEDFIIAGSFNYYELGVDYDDGDTDVDVTYKFYGPMLTLGYRF
ncbi:hypothetical protein EK599_21765 [Vibrio sp. T187]|uniref:hypothetical protein n=1 Tax=Vibrio TaxID=662 RepID=UPI0010C9B109|nr:MULTISPECIES: hypothetical protein [Vibrio]MBW3698305.1 hypothetical protein [Vibrio sp. T187]